MEEEEEEQEEKEEEEEEEEEELSIPSSLCPTRAAIVAVKLSHQK